MAGENFKDSESMPSIGGFAEFACVSIILHSAGVTCRETVTSRKNQPRLKVTSSLLRHHPLIHESCMS